MKKSAQLKAGKELITNSQEAWLGYYLFAGLALVILGGGYMLLRTSGFAGPDYWIALIGILILALVSLGISIMCHILGHIVDALEEMKDDRKG